MVVNISKAQKKRWLDWIDERIITFEERHKQERKQWKTFRKQVMEEKHDIFRKI